MRDRTDKTKQVGLVNQKKREGELLGLDIQKYCCEACYTARDKRCECKCKGRYYSLGTQLNSITDDVRRITIDLAWVVMKLTTDPFCICGTDLSHEDVMGYDHECGWVVQGFDKCQWLYVECPHCRYEMAVWKMGVPRDAIIAVITEEKTKKNKD